MLDRTYPLALYTPQPRKVVASYPRGGKVDIFPVAAAAAWSRYCRPDLPQVDRSRYILFREFSEGNLLIRKLCWVSAQARKGKGEDIYSGYTVSSTYAKGFLSVHYFLKFITHIYSLHKDYNLDNER